MLDELVRRLFFAGASAVAPSGTLAVPSALGMHLLHGAQTRACWMGHASATPDHLLHAALELTDLHRPLLERGIHVEDVGAINERLLLDHPVVELSEPPPYGPELVELFGGPSLAASAILEWVAARLPRELAFFGAPLRVAIRSVAPQLDVQLPLGADGRLDVSRWDDDLTVALGRALANARNLNERGRVVIWEIGPHFLLGGILETTRYVDYFRSKGIVRKDLIYEVARAGSPRSGPLKSTRVPGHRVGLAASFYALLLRAVRYADEDGTGVRLRHVLAALHDEPSLAPIVAKLAST